MEAKYANSALLACKCERLRRQAVRELLSMTEDGAMRWLEERAPAIPVWEIAVDYAEHHFGHGQKELTAVRVYPREKILGATDLDRVGTFVFLTEEECKQAVDEYYL